MPVMLNSCAPPQVMFSSLGIVSPPPISIVLRQVRELTESDVALDQWPYQHGTVEQVFCDLFSFLQGTFSIKTGFHVYHTLFSRVLYHSIFFIKITMKISVQESRMPSQIVLWSQSGVLLSNRVDYFSDWQRI